MPEPTFGLEELARACLHGGAEFQGLQERPARGPLLLFRHPVSRSTLQLDPVEVLADRVRARVGGQVPPRFVQIACASAPSWAGGVLVLGLTDDGETWIFTFETARWAPLANPNPTGGPR